MKYYPINRWNATGIPVKFPFTYKTATEAAEAGHKAEEEYKDQTFEQVVGMDEKLSVNAIWDLLEIHQSQRKEKIK